MAGRVLSPSLPLSHTRFTRSQKKASSCMALTVRTRGMILFSSCVLRTYTCCVRLLPVNQAHHVHTSWDEYSIGLCFFGSQLDYHTTSREKCAYVCALYNARAELVLRVLWALVKLHSHRVVLKQISSFLIKLIACQLLCTSVCVCANMLPTCMYMYILYMQNTIYGVCYM